MPKPKLRAHLFGILSLQADGTSLPLPTSAVARRLLAYLLLQKDRPHNRSVLAGIFWAESTEAKARKSLSQALWHIRQTFPDLIDASADEIVVAEPDTVWTDTQEFETAINAHLSGVQESAAPIGLGAALELYRSELLEGIYDDWVLLERARYSDLYLRGLEKLAKLEKMSGNYPRALDLTQQLLKIRPYEEAFHQEVMRLYHLLGKADAALRQYENCCEILKNEFGIEPDTKTVLLAEEIARQSASVASIYLPKPIKSQKPPNLDPKRVTSLTLVGREGERDELIQHLEAAFQQRGGMVLMEGEPGVGKTRLLREIVKDAEWRNAQILWGYCLEQEAAQPFGPFVTAVNQGLSPLRVRQLSAIIDPLWLQVLKPLLPQIAQTLPKLGDPPPLKPDQERARLLEAMVNFLTGWASIAPLLFIIEDLHWADEDTLSLLPVLQNRLAEHRILLVGTFRGEDARTESTVWKRLQALDRAGLRGRLILDQLDLPATGELIRRYLGLLHSAPIFEKRIYEETGGNPLFILETLRTLQDEGLLTQDGAGGWKTPWDNETVDYAELPLPPMVEELIARRLERLSPRTHQVLGTGAVLGYQFDFSLLVAMCELDAINILEPVQDLVNRHLWEETEAGYQFSHAKVRQVGLNALDADQAKALHQRAAEAVESQAPENIEALAYHYESAGLWQKAAGYASQAGLAAMSAHAYTTARTHFEKTLAFATHLGDGNLDRFELLTAYEKVLDVLGDRNIQRETLDEMQSLAEGDSEKLYLVYLRQAWLFAQISKFDQAQEAARQALALAKELNDPAHQASALDALGTALTWQGNNEEAVPYLEEAVSLGREIADVRAEAHYRSSLGSALLGVKRYVEAQNELLASLELMKSDPRELADTYNLLGILYMEQGMADKAITSYQNSLNNSQKTGFLYGQGRAFVNLGNLHYFQGRFGTTLEFYAQAIPIFAQIEQKRGEVQLRLNRASMYQTFFGDSDQVVEDAKYCLSYAEETGDLIGAGQALTVLGESSRQKKDWQAARQYLEGAVEKFEMASERWMLVQVFGILALLAIDIGDWGESLERTAAAITISEEVGMPDMIPRMLTVRGTAFYYMNEYLRALDVLAKAIEKMTPGAENPFLTHYWHSKVLTALGRDDEARQAMEQAYQILQKSLGKLSPKDRQMSLENVAEHCEIVAAWERIQPNRITVTIPGSAGGTVNVRWTVDAPDDEQISGKVARRRQKLRRLLQEADEQGGAPTYQHLAEALKVGLRTIERDMAALSPE